MPIRLRPTLTNINLKIGRSDFIAITGSVGSGKTSFLLSMLGELDRTDGTIQMNDNHDGIGVVTQDRVVKPTKNDPENKNSLHA